MINPSAATDAQISRTSPHAWVRTLQAAYRRAITSGEAKQLGLSQIPTAVELMRRSEPTRSEGKAPTIYDADEREQQPPGERS